MIATQALWARNPDSAIHAPTQVYTDSHLPQHYTDGYLVAVDTIYLGAQATDEWTGTDNLTVSVMIEAVVESLDEKSAMALALSQS